jgi:hypothetical protein
MTLIGVPEGAALLVAVVPPLAAVVAAVVPLLLLLEHAAARTTLTAITTAPSRTVLNRAAARADEKDLFIRFKPPWAVGSLRPHDAVYH